MTNDCYLLNILNSLETGKYDVNLHTVICLSSLHSINIEEETFLKDFQVILKQMLQNY